MISFLGGAVLMYVLMYIFGTYIKRKASNLTTAAVMKNMPYGELIITDYLTVEEVFYCLVNLIQEDKTNRTLRFVNIMKNESNTDLTLT